MEAEKTYQNKVARTIQQKRNGEGALEFADNRPAGILQAISKNKLNHLTQFQVPTSINQNPKPQARIITSYNPHGNNTPLSPIDRPRWQEGYRNAYFRYKYNTDNPNDMITDVTGLTAPIWAMEMDHIIPWSQILKTMLDDGRYTLREARLYYHDVDNLQTLNSHSNRIKSDNDSPTYSVPDTDFYLGTLPRETLNNVTKLIYDINNTSILLSYDSINLVKRTYIKINQEIFECRKRL